MHLNSIALNRFPFHVCMHPYNYKFNIQNLRILNHYTLWHFLFSTCGCVSPERWAMDIRVFFITKQIIFSCRTSQCIVYKFCKWFSLSTPIWYRKVLLRFPTAAKHKLLCVVNLKFIQHKASKTSDICRAKNCIQTKKHRPKTLLATFNIIHNARNIDRILLHFEFALHCGSASLSSFVSSIVRIY